uniref:Protein NifY n=1 Tax=Azospirillum brasilense TaxID=192 RepID=NIFY_AZOBR|nr:RecName: Full=Protein NifY [Azospirillum brasilense]AAB02346.1 nifY [Azospirillum brasilense]
MAARAPAARTLLCPAFRRTHSHDPADRQSPVPFRRLWPPCPRPRRGLPAATTSRSPSSRPTPQLHIALPTRRAGRHAPDLAALFEAVGVRHVPGVVTTIHADAARWTSPHRRRPVHPALRPLRPGRRSRLFTPPIPGLAEHAFNVDAGGVTTSTGERIRPPPSSGRGAAANPVGAADSPASMTVRARSADPFLAGDRHATASSSTGDVALAARRPRQRCRHVPASTL